MNLQKVLWSCLVGSCMIIASLLGAWGHGVDKTDIRQDTAISAQAAAEAAHEQDLRDIHEDLLRIEKLLEDRHGSH